MYLPDLFSFVSSECLLECEYFCLEVGIFIGLKCANFSELSARDVITEEHVQGACDCSPGESCSHFHSLSRRVT